MALTWIKLTFALGKLALWKPQLQIIFSYFVKNCNLMWGFFLTHSNTVALPGYFIEFPEDSSIELYCRNTSVLLCHRHQYQRQVIVMLRGTERGRFQIKICGQNPLFITCGPFCV